METEVELLELLDAKNVENRPKHWVFNGIIGGTIGEPSGDSGELEMQNFPARFTACRV